MLLFANRRFFCFRKKYVIFLHLLVSWISHLKVMNKKHWNFAIASIVYRFLLAKLANFISAEPFGSRDAEDAEGKT